jgi:DNA gyrase subunit A
VAEDDADIFCVTREGYGKRTPVSSYPTQRRGGQGVITIKDSPDRGDLVGVATVRNNHELLLMSQEGTVIRMPVESVRTTGRNTMGVKVMNLRGADKVSSMARLVGSTPGNGEGNGGGETDLGADLLAAEEDLSEYITEEDEDSPGLTQDEVEED